MADLTPIDRLKANLQTSGLSQKNHPLFQVIDQLIGYVRQFKLDTQNAIDTLLTNSVTDRIIKLNLNTDIPSTNLGSKTAGFYNIIFYFETTTADAAAGSNTNNITYNDDTGPVTFNLGTLSLTAVGNVKGVVPIKVVSGNVAFSSTNGGGYGTAKYAYNLICQKISE